MGFFGERKCFRLFRFRVLGFRVRTDCFGVQKSVDTICRCYNILSIGKASVFVMGRCFVL
jgi:hypothetical protein